jgi:hypothetical protein
LANGILVGANKVPASNAAWTNAPFEAQYLKLYDVTPPPAPGPPGTPKPYVIGTNATFSWATASDPEGGIAGYRVAIGTAPGGSNVFSGTITGTSQTVGGTLGQTLYATVWAINNAGIESSAAGPGAGTILLDATGDNDGDGMSNGHEDIAATNPLDASSALRILNLSSGNLLTWASVSNKTYRVLATEDWATNFTPISGVITANSTTASYLDTGAVANTVRFYRVNVLP